MHVPPAPQESSAQPAKAVPGAGLALALLLAINMFNYIDRQNLSAVTKYLRDAFVPNDPNANFKMGILTSAFMVTYMSLSPVFGWLGDRYSRWKLIGIGVILWSLASGLSGLAWVYPILLLSRCFVGVGEAAYGPAAPSVISDLYPIEKRGQKMAWFYMAIPVGSALGFVLGGQLSLLLSWHWAFYAVVPPGILLGVLCFFMKEPPRGSAAAPIRKRSWRDYLELFKIPSYSLNAAGMTAMTFVLGGVAAWMPTYLYEREARFELTAERLGKMAANAEAPPVEVQDRIKPLQGPGILTYHELKPKLSEALSPEQLREHGNKVFELLQTDDSPKLDGLNTTFGIILAVGGIVATLLGGIAGDRLRPYMAGSYFVVSGVGMLIGLPLFVAALFTPFPWAWGLLFGAVFFLFFNTGPTNTALANVTHPTVRATAFAVNIFVIHALGDAISPSIIGAIADLTSLSTAIVVVSVLIPVSGAFWLCGAKYLKRDTDRVLEKPLAT